VVKEPFHEGAAVMAVLAIQAGFKGKFWEANDALYQLMTKQDNVFNTEDLAKAIGLNPQDLAGAFDDPKPFQKMIKDIRAGMKLGLSGTPSYVIDDVVYEGGIPADILANILSVDSTEKHGGHTN
jgi:protein-disulfide isomerase